MKELTAVEWLIKQINPYGVSVHQDLFEQAKAMFEKQIIEAHFNGCETGEMFNNENRAFITDSEEYYNRTFKQQEQ